MQDEHVEETIRPFDPAVHREPVVGLWSSVFGYDSPHNEPDLVIDKKTEADDGLFFVAVVDGTVVGTIMAGYDGHRGWIYSLAVVPQLRRRGIGARLLRHAEQRLVEMGCPKINLQIIDGNEAIVAFYRRHGYTTERRISMGRRIPIESDD